MKIKTLSVTQLNSYVKKLIDNDFVLTNLSVKGEISNLKYHTSGHIYFSLKDDCSKINCIMFRNKAENLLFKLEDGTNVIIKGKVSVYATNGSLQIYCEEIEKDGVGNLYLQYEQLKNKLSKEGYFNIYSKKKIPEFVYNVGVVTSPTGAAIEDIKNVIFRRNKFVNIILYPALVQGKDAYKTIIDGIKYFNNEKNVDVIIVGRGGGSIEELWNFNEEKLAIEIFNSQIPIISAVGHEVDYTISDLVADVRAATPSQAGEIAVQLDSDIYNLLHSYKERLDEKMLKMYEVEKNRVNNFSKILDLNSPIKRIANCYLEIDNAEKRLLTLVNNKFKFEANKLISMNSILQAHNPLNILGKGYAIIEDENGKILKEKNEFIDNMNIQINVKDGIVQGVLTLK